MHVGLKLLKLLPATALRSESQSLAQRVGDEPQLRCHMQLHVCALTMRRLLQGSTPTVSGTHYAFMLDLLCP